MGAAAVDETFKLRHPLYCVGCTLSHKIPDQIICDLFSEKTSDCEYNFNNDKKPIFQSVCESTGGKMVNGGQLVVSCHFDKYMDFDRGGGGVEYVFNDTLA